MVKTARLRLYVAGPTPTSLRAIDDLLAACDHVEGIDIQVEIVDLLENPDAAGQDRIDELPTVVWREPRPARRLNRACSDHHDLESWLGLLAAAGESDRQVG